MKRLIFLLAVLSIILTACLPASVQTQAAPTANLEATAAILSQQTLQSLPTPTLLPSETPVIVPPSETPTQPTPTETQNPILLTLTATLGTGTVAANGISGTQLTSIPGSLQATTTPSSTLDPAIATGTAHFQYYGTMPPNLPFGEVILINKSKAEVYVSLQCTTKEGYVTIIEYPVKNTVEAKAPIGQYVYVIWVGGNKLVGDFSLTHEKDIKITIFKDRATVK
jgi:hypothetical protein